MLLIQNGTSLKGKVKIFNEITRSYLNTHFINYHINSKGAEDTG